MKHLKQLKSVTAFILTLIMLVTSAPNVLFAQETPAAIPPADRFGTTKILFTGTTKKFFLDDSYYFSDKWFLLDPTINNPGLALLSMQLTAAAVEEDANGVGGTFLKDMGFENIGFRDSADKNAVDCNFTYGKKQLEDGSTLVAVTIQSLSFNVATTVKGWTQNFTVNGEGMGQEHYGLSKAADHVLDEIVSLSGSGKVRYWIMGHSRGGALANLLAARLPGKLGNRNQGIYAYTFEAPAIVEPASEAQRKSFVEDYPYIHNYVCVDDPVTMVPPWGMMIYGVTHIMDTDEADAALEEQLKKMGSPAEIPDDYNRETSRERSESLLRSLETAIPTREKYSEIQEETVLLADGSSKKFTYNYQDLFRKLIGFIFSGALDNVSLDNISSYENEASAMLNSYVRAYLLETGVINEDKDPSLYYWDAAEKAYGLLPLILNTDTGFTVEELYLILKLAAPILIDKDAGEITDYDLDSGDPLAALVYVAGALALPSVAFSHHFDVAVARLKTLAPAPALNDISITLEEDDLPKAGDSAGKMSESITKALAGLDSSSWLTASAQWQTNDTTLANDKDYYLDVTFTIPGHNVEKDISLAINETAPLTMDIKEAGGVATIKATWKYTLGTPATYTISFDTGGIGENPESIQVESGTILKHYSEIPTPAEVEGYRFDDWENDEHVSYNDITVTGDLLLKAHWIKLIDTIKASFDIPHVGETWKEPTLAEDADVIIEGIYISDSSYNNVTEITKKEKHTLCFVAYPNKENVEFKTIRRNGRTPSFNGSFLINDEKAIVAYYEDDGQYLQVYWTFTPLDEAAPEPENPDPTNPDPGKQDPAKQDPGKQDPGKQSPGNSTQDNKEPLPAAITSLEKGTAAAAAEKLLLATSSDKDPQGAQYLPLKLKSGKTTKKSIHLTWAKTAGAQSYLLYGALSGKNKLKKIATVKGNAYTVKTAPKALKKGKYYKFALMAVDKDNKLVTASSIIHAATKGSKKCGNCKSLSLKVKKAGSKKYKAASSLSLKKGKSAKIKATITADKNTKIKKILKTRYATSNPAVATVTSSGKIKAVSKGSCKIYSYSQNGISKKIKITVK